MCSQLCFQCRDNSPSPSSTLSDKTHFHLKWLKNVFSFWTVLIGTITASVGAGTCTSSWLCRDALPGTSTPVPSTPDVSTAGVGFVSYAISNRPRCIIMCARTRESRRRRLMFSAWLLVPIQTQPGARTHHSLSYPSLAFPTADPVDADVVVTGVDRCFGLVAAAASFRSDWKAAALPPAPEAKEEATETSSAPVWHVQHRAS